jgi:crotonobetainyl-CoA:carnitine CoA-transferase CaiB-like acyl-CoA transferase
MGPLHGLRILEFAGIGPGPMCAMLLADLGATVLRIDRVEPVDLGQKRPVRFNLLLRNRKSIRVDLKKAAAVELALDLVARADALIEGFRPGVMERLGLGPAVCLARQPRLVYGRMTGWGQSGPLANAAGHDLNYIALSGALASIGRRGAPPTPPLNLVADFGGGALYLAFGVLAGIIEAKSSGSGQVVDAAMVDGAASLMTSIYGAYAGGLHKLERGTNVTDTGAYFYDAYECADGEWISIATIEGRFHAELLRRLEIDPGEIGEQFDAANWPKARALLSERFKRRTRDQWCELLEGTDACFAPVLSLAQAPNHPHMRARGTFVEVDGVIQPGVAPRFGRSQPPLPTSPEKTLNASPEEALDGWLDAAAIAKLRSAGTLA